MQPEENKIPELVCLLCERLREWGEGSSTYPIGDLDKAASALKKLQDIYAVEQGYQSAETSSIIVTHHIPRAEEECEA